MNTIYTIPEEVFLRAHPSGLVQLIRIDEKDVYFEANLVAAEIIAMIDGKRSDREILSQVTNQYADTHHGEIVAKGQALFEKLAGLGLIVEAHT